MRKLMWFVFGFGPACAVYTYLFPEDYAIPIAAAFLLLSGAWFLLGRQMKWGKRPGCCCRRGVVLGI